MASRSFVLFALVLLALMGGPGVAQEPDAQTVLQASLKAMGGDTLKTIQYSGTGYVGGVGQNVTPTADWPRTDLTSYTRTIDYDAKSSKKSSCSNRRRDRSDDKR